MSAIEIPASSLFTEPPDPRGLGGLIILFQRREVPLPLRSVKVRASICGPFCRTVVEQRFSNDMDAPMEATHIFPLPPDGAVVEMELRAGEVVVRAECRQREAAEQAFNEARRAGHRAALLSAERADVHTLKVANLPPRTDVIVRIVIVEQLEAADGRMRWRFPTVIAPRYMPGQGQGHSGTGVAADTEFVPDASRISPPLRLAGGVPLDLEVEIEGPVRSLESALHALRLDLGSVVRVAPSAKATLNKDFILSFSTAEDAQTVARAWTDGQHTALLFEGPAVATLPSVPRDAVFVVDISGSMDGGKMEAAKRALIAALHGLMPGDRFRLIAFDDRLEHFRADFCTYDDTSLKAADAWIGRLYARGGTEMLPALTAALDGTTPAGRMRTVLFITDGQAGDESRLAAAVSNRRQAGRLFTLGIDTAVNAALLQQLARLGGGTCELCAPTDDIESVVVRLEARFGSPLLEGILVDGMIAARPEPQALFSGRPVGILLEGSAPAVTVRAHGHAGAQSWTLTPARTGASLGALWGRARISYLEDRLSLKPFEEEAIKPEILRIALAHNLVSRFTSLIAIDRSVTVTGAAIPVTQPVELPEGWSQGFLGAGAQNAPGASGGGGSRGAPAPLSAPAPLRKRAPPMAAPTGAPPPAPVVSRSAVAGPMAPITLMEKDEEIAVFSAPSLAAPALDSLDDMDESGMDSFSDAGITGAAAPMEQEEADEKMKKDASSTAFFAVPAPARRAAPAAPPPPPSPAKGGLLGRIRDFFGVADAPAEPPSPEPVIAEEAAPAAEPMKLAERSDRAALKDSNRRLQREEKAEAPKPKPLPLIDEAALARSQGADGAIGGDPGRSAAALLLLLLWGHTRRKGLRSRTVQKLALWLAAHRADPRVATALDALDAAERGEVIGHSAGWSALYGCGPEGATLQATR